MSERRRKNLQIIFNNTSVIPFKWRRRYVCFYCGQAYAEYTEFRKHTKAHGPLTPKDYALKTIRGRHVEVKLDISEINCEICNKPSQNFKEIIDHLIAEHNIEYDRDIETLFQEYRLVDNRCQFCNEQFTYFGYLGNHMNTVHQKNNFICNGCGIVFNKKRNLAAHLRHCHRESGYSYQLRDHPDDGKLKCTHCLKEFHSSQGLKQHLSRCKTKAGVIISDSSKDRISNIAEDKAVQPKKKQNTLQIRKNIHTVLNLSTAVPFMFLSQFSCFYCSKKFVEFDDLKQHTSNEHPVCDLNAKYLKRFKGDRVTVKVDVSSLSCKVCQLPIDEFDDLLDHIITKHQSPYDRSILGCLEPFKVIKDNIACPLCPNVFRYFGILLRHINSDHSNNNRICEFCGKSFKDASNLNMHITNTHTGSCECDICGSKFKNQWCLGRHRAKCHNAKDFKCPKCPERFQSQYHKQKHLIKVHDIGHRCNYCNKMFTRNSFMKDHVRRTHLKEKNVPCSVCNERFFDNYLLKMHMVKHKGERRFSCDVCGKAFLRRSNLSSHMEMHKKYGHVGTL